jgi:hypothetical protein
MQRSYMHRFNWVHLKLILVILAKPPYIQQLDYELENSHILLLVIYRGIDIE